MRETPAKFVLVREGKEVLLDQGLKRPGLALPLTGAKCDSETGKDEGAGRKDKAAVGAGEM